MKKRASGTGLIWTIFQLYGGKGQSERNRQNRHGQAAEVFPQGDNAPAGGGNHYPASGTGIAAQAEPGEPVEILRGGTPAGAPPLRLMGGYRDMAKKLVRPKITVQPVYSGGADMREVFISLLVDAVRRGKCPVRTFENLKEPQYNKGRNQEKEVI